MRFKEFYLKESKPTEQQLKKAVVIGTSEKEQCELCGKEGLSKTIALKLPNGDVVCYGTTCATKTLFYINAFKGLNKNQILNKAMDAQKATIDAFNGDIAMSEPFKRMYTPISNVLSFSDSKPVVDANIKQIKTLVGIAKKELKKLEKKYPTVDLDYVRISPFTNSGDEIKFRKINNNIIPKDWGFKRNVKSVYR